MRENNLKGARSRRKWKLQSLLMILMIFFSTTIFGQSSNPDFIQSIGKIYVVVAVVLVTFLGMIFFMIYIERKIKKLEKEIKDL